MEYLKEHISKIISQNEAIMEVVEPALQKKYHKITGISRCFGANENPSSKLTMAFLKQREDSLNSTAQSSSYTNACTSSSSNSVTTITTTSTITTVTQSTPGPSGQNVRRTLPTLQQQAQLVLQAHAAASTLPYLSSTSTSSSSSSPSTHQPLNLTKTLETSDSLRKRCYSEGFSALDVATHPQNPERSIIKDLLLNSRGLAVPSGGEGEDAIYTCILCKINFRSADNLKYHTQHYCQGQPNASPQSAPISPVGSPSHKYFRSNSFSCNLPEKYNPNTLAKLASSTLRHPHRTPLTLAKLAQTQIRPGGRQKPENIVINTKTCPAPVPLTINTVPTIPATTQVAVTVVHPSVSAQCTQITKLIEIDAPLPSPGPLLGKTRLVDTYNADTKTEEAIISHFSGNDVNFVVTKHLDKYVDMDMDTNKNCKRPKLDTVFQPQSPSSVFYNSAIESPSPNTRLLQMCGGDIKIVERREDITPRFGSSGGSIVSISPSPDSQMSDQTSSLSMRSGLHSGGSVVNYHQAVKDSVQQQSSITPKYMVNVTPNQLTPNMGHSTQFFQFPPINSITGYNPLTLPPVTTNLGHASQILHGGKLIPFVPGMPGPNSLAAPKNDLVSTKRASPNNRRMIPSPLSLAPTPPIHTPPLSTFTVPTQHSRHTSPVVTPRLHIVPTIKIADMDESIKPRKLGKNGFTMNHLQPPQMQLVWPTKQEFKKKFNFSRIADNLSPRKVEQSNERIAQKSPDPEFRYFNFEKPELLLRTQDIRPQHVSPLHIDVSSSPQQQNAAHHEPETTAAAAAVEQPMQKPTKFLRPSTLPLKPGTFTPKRHHGITPTANTLPLISPETPRPSKNCVQLYLNGHAYTYLGLKCSTKPFYCTVNRPQPVHFTNQHKLSIYSNWQICAESNPHPLGLTPKTVMSLYDSRQRPTKMSVAKIGPTCATLHSQSLIVTPIDQQQNGVDTLTTADSCNVSYSGSNSVDHMSAAIPIVPGGYESNEDYTYVRGRGRGRYVCSECGIRCKKPSMLKKHIRTHTDVRPYTCQHCSFR